MTIDGIEHTIDLFQKNIYSKRFYMVHGKMFFLIETFLSSRRLSIA